VNQDPERERFLWQHQWCQLHLGICETVDVLRRKTGFRSVPVLACPECIRDLKSTGYLRPSRWAGQDCWEIRGIRPTERKPYILELKWVDALLLRALGFTVQEASGDNEEAS